MRSMLISINEFRGFKKIDNINIAPLTILVGENSAGKTSFLAAIRLMHEFFSSPEVASFNREPFLLGAFDQIAHSRGGQYGRASSFSFKVEMKLQVNARTRFYTRETEQRDRIIDENIACEVEFINEFSTPAVKRVELNYLDGAVNVERQSDGSLNIRTKSFEETVQDDSSILNLSDERAKIRNIIFALEELPYLFSRRKEMNKKLGQQLEKLELVSVRFRAFRNELRSAIYASAPVRSEPGRAYTPLDANPSPQGSHIPYLLAKLKRHDATKWDDLKSKIDQFGKESGMFNKIDVKNLGRSESDPFQIYFDFGGPKRNIIDVGYGISQILPLITEVMSRDIPTKFLFQQPEVHLHPQAQAALGSFLASETRAGKHSFVIESHSDYIIDRARMAVRDKILKPQDVSILYFRRNRLESRIDQITIDENGNIINAPADYRRFFLEEETRSIG